MDGTKYYQDYLNGDDTALAQIIRLYKDGLILYLNGYVKNIVMAEELTDTITVTVEFTDGTKEIAVIEITVDDDGQIYGTFKGVDVIG